MKMTPMWWGCLLLIARSGLAELPPGLLRAIGSQEPVESRSGQFLVSFVPGRVNPLPPLTGGSAPEQRVRQLTPDLLAVSCERIKHELFRGLEIPERAGNRIFVTIRRNASKEEPINFVATIYPDGWQYRLEFPEQMEEEKVLRAVVQALLVEFANRQARERSAEIPLWLAEGLTQQLLALAEADLVLEPSKAGQQIGSGRAATALSFWKGVNNEGIRRDALFEARRVLSNNAPLSFTDLSLPDLTAFNALKWEVYKSCSQLFVYQLLGLSGGHTHLRTMLASLPQYLNWQTAFLGAFRENFGNLLDVEKWWAIGLANFTGREQWQMWPRAASLERLNATLLLPIQVQAGTNELPARTEMSLQQIVQELDFGRQRILLGRALTQLVALRPRMPPELVPLLNGYCQVLEAYLEARKQAGFAVLRRGQPSIDGRMLAEDTVRKLATLDQHRKALVEQNAEAMQSRQGP